MPTSDELPAPLAALARRQALELPSNQFFHAALDRLIVSIKDIPAKGNEGPGPGNPPGRPRRLWTWDLFEKDAVQKGLRTPTIEAIKAFHDKLRSDLGAQIRWGAGQTYGWYAAKWPFCSSGIIGATSHGKLSIAFGNLGGSETEKAFRDKLKDLAVERLGIPIADDFRTKFPNCEFEWVANVDLLIELLKGILPIAAR